MLPLLVGTGEQRKRIRDAYPILNHKQFKIWDDGIPAIVDALKARVSGAAPPQKVAEAELQSATFEVPIPKIRKRYTQRDKDRFVLEGFRIIREYLRLEQQRYIARIKK